MLATIIFAFPIAVIQLVNPYSLAGGGVDKLPLAQVNAAVGGSRLVGGEEYQIPCLQLASSHALA